MLNIERKDGELRRMWEKSVVAYLKVPTIPGFSWRAAMCRYDDDYDDNDDEYEYEIWTSLIHNSKLLVEGKMRTEGI
jgi:hypothetical protein